LRLDANLTKRGGKGTGMTDRMDMEPQMGHSKGNVEAGLGSRCVRSLTAVMVRDKEGSRQRRQEREWGVARDTQVPHGTLHLRSPTGPNVSRDVQAMSVRRDQTGPGKCYCH
jgi:hypothetical protein